VLIVGAETPALQRVVPLLLRADFVVQRVARADEAAGLLAVESFDLVIVRHPTSGLGLAELIAGIRAADGRNRSSGVLLLADPERVGDIRAFLSHGVNRVLSLEGSSDRLLLAVADMIAVPPRLSMRAVVQLELWVEQGPVRSLSLTRNISATGMLVQGGAEFPVGSRLRFELVVPGEESPIRGAADVVRHAAEGAVEGIGVRFCSFEDDGMERLNHQLGRRQPSE
jgi:DNA-binding NarL/FixJ family response regulator